MTSVPTPPPAPLSSQAKLIISLLLLVHLFCAIIGLLAAMAPSRLVADLHSKALGFYTQSLGLDLNYDWSVAPLCLTQGTDMDVDSVLEVELPADSTQRVDWNATPRNTNILLWPDVGAPGSDRRARYRRLANYVSHMTVENRNVAPLLAQAIAGRAMQEHDATEARVRVRRHLLQSPDDIFATEDQRNDPYSARYYFSPNNDEHYFEYQAKLVDGEVIVIQVAAARDVAPVRDPAGGAKE